MGKVHERFVLETREGFDAVEQAITDYYYTFNFCADMDDNIGIIARVVWMDYCTKGITAYVTAEWDEDFGLMPKVETELKHSSLPQLKVEPMENPVPKPMESSIIVKIIHIMFEEE